MNLFLRTLFLITAITTLVNVVPPNAAAESKEKVKSSKVIDFEDEVVEGLNKRPLDSLSQISERNRKRHKPHLYLKRAGFRTETEETLRVAKFTP
jgi:predicted HicB family RNase H-like nuclease